MLVAAVLFAASGLLAAQSFENPRRVAALSDPSVVIPVDLDGDGRLDLVYDTPAYQATPAVLHTLLADGRGGYRQGPDYTLPVQLSSRCVAGDFNGDGKGDLICVSGGIGSEAGVLLSGGDGSFQPMPLAHVPGPFNGDAGECFPAAVADFNGDGALDLLLGCQGSTGLVPMLGDGKGRLTAGTATPIYGTYASVADLNGDGKLDVVAQAAGSATTQVLLGKGDGTFAPGMSLSGNRNVVLADMDGDGQLDVVGGGFDQLRIFHGNGDGTFATSPEAQVNFTHGSQSQTGTEVYVQPFAVRDLNGDGIPDVLAFAHDGLTVLRGGPGLTFAAPQDYAVGQSLFLTSPLKIQLADMDGDGHLDVVSIGPDGVWISYWRGNGSFAGGGHSFLNGAAITQVALADFDEDGIPDSVTSGDLQMYLRKGVKGGLFGDAAALPFALPAAANSAVTGWASVTAGDVNGDGHQDLVASGTSGVFQTDVFLLAGHGTGQFDAPRSIATLMPFQTVRFVTDLTGDGRADIVLSDGSTVEVLVSQPNGSFRAVSTTLMATGTPAQNNYPAQTFRLADVNGDGVPDLVYGSTTALAVANGVGDGSFAAPMFYPLPPTLLQTSSGAGDVSIGDFDGDGQPDVALLMQGNDSYHLGSSQLVLFYGRHAAAGGGQAAFDIGTGPAFPQAFLGALSAADVTGDGIRDLIVYSPDTVYAPDRMLVFPGRSDRSLASPNLFTAGAPSQLQFADINGDGLPDMVSVQAAGNAFLVFLNQTAPSVTGTLTGVPNPIIAGSPFTLKATVGLPAQTTILQGSVSFSVDGNALGSSLLGANAASLPGPAKLSIGYHTLSALVSGLSDGQTTYPNIQLTGTEVVTGIPVAVTMTANPQTAVAGQSVQLQATVGNGAGIPVGSAAPTGAVNVTVDGLAVGSGGVLTNGLLVLTLPYSTTSVGTHAVVASYGGDATHSAGSATVQLTITASPAQGSFQIGLSPASVSLATGQSVSTTVQLASVGGYAGTVLLSVGPLPAGLRAVLQPGQVTVPAAGKATSALTLSAGQSGTGGTYPRTRVAGLGGATVLMLLLLPGLRSSSRRTLLHGLLCLGLLASGTVALSGCGLIRLPLSGSVNATTYMVPVTATDTDTGQTQSTTLTVVVSQ